MISIDYIGRGGLEINQKWLRNTWPANNTSFRAQDVCQVNISGDRYEVYV